MTELPHNVPYHRGVAHHSPWQGFQSYLLEKIAAFRQFTFSCRNSLLEDDAAITDFEFFYAGQDLAASPIFQLPQELLLMIFSNLNCADLCRCAKVCRLWRQVSEDPLMWSARLEEDSRRWPFASNLTFVDKELSAKAPAKAAYLRCSPEFRGGETAPAGKAPPASSPASTRRRGAPITGLLRSWFPKRNPQFLLSEGDPCLKFMRQVLHNKCNAFVPVSMFSAQWFNNSGLTFKMSSDSLFDLVNFSQNTPRAQGIFEPAPAPEPVDAPLTPESVSSGCEEDAEEQPEIFGTKDTPEPSLVTSNAFAQYLHTIDGLIFLINAEDTPVNLRRRRAEFVAMTKALASRPHVPILIFALVMDDETKRKCSCVSMARFLKLIRLRNPWLICDARSKGLYRVVDSFQWLLNRQVT